MNHLILHIPHASTHIPFVDGFNLSLIEAEQQLLTDWETDKIFDVPEVTKLICGFSRIFCDVERLPDEMESMYQFGRGFFYTHTDNGKELRREIHQIKNRIYEDYYLKHHRSLNAAVVEKLNQYNRLLIIDCHSFSDEPFKTDLDKNTGRPDICIGTDNFHTPNRLTECMVAFFLNKGYSVRVNSPYSGTIVPLEFYKKEPKVKSIMIEINRKLYMQINGEIISAKVKELNGYIKTMINEFTKNLTDF